MTLIFLYPTVPVVMCNSVKMSYDTPYQRNDCQNKVWRRALSNHSLKEYDIDEMEQSQVENGIGSCIDGSFNGCHNNGKWASYPQSLCTEVESLIRTPVSKRRAPSISVPSSSLRQEASALLDKSFNYYALPLASK